MLQFTKQERLVLVYLACVFVLGTTLRVLIKRFPVLFSWVYFLPDKAYVTKLDINTASQEELMSLPYVGRVTAENILNYRQEQGDFKHLEELQRVKGIGPDKFSKIILHVAVYEKENFSP